MAMPAGRVTARAQGAVWCLGENLGEEVVYGHATPPEDFGRIS
jgi:hypothetical protein